MVMIQKAYTPLAVIFFIPIIFIGAFFLLNLTLAVIKIKFTEEHKKQKSNPGKKKKKIVTKRRGDDENEDSDTSPKTGGDEEIDVKKLTPRRKMIFLNNQRRDQLIEKYEKMVAKREKD